MLGAECVCCPVTSSTDGQVDILGTLGEPLAGGTSVCDEARCGVGPFGKGTLGDCWGKPPPKPVDEMCFFSISAQRQTSGLMACAEYPFARVCNAAEFRRKGRRSPSTATPRGRPPQTRNDDDPPHTTEGPPQARQAAACPISCSFHLLPTLVYRNGACVVATPAAKNRM